MQMYLEQSNDAQPGVWRCAVRFVLIVVSAIGMSGCGASVTKLHSRASFDLNCPSDQLQVLELDNRTRGVRGCSRQATYVEDCSTPARAADSCTWVLNSDNRPK
jgi:hypothetical protein